ncbi:MAG: hypothetical protein LBU18_05960 [Treponema sp.]|jgi:hypothetical protein|nr:hypothetical protein [Treponema sp.]
MERHPARDFLIEKIEQELKKDADDIDGDFIAGMIDELYALDGLSPPEPSEDAPRAAARTVRARAAWRRQNTLARRKLKRRFICGVYASCCVFLLFFSANYATTLVTGTCIPSKVGIKICCGTKYCLCDITKTEHGNP